jgi:hypothetical protein
MRRRPVTVDVPPADHAVDEARVLEAERGEDTLAEL